MSLTISRPPQFACHNPCRLPYHVPGSRVMWQRWDDARKRFVWKRGTVLSHANRTLGILPDVGDELMSSCGFVVAERGR